MRQLNIIKIPATTSLVIAGTTFIYFPQTSSATSFTSRSFAHCSSSVSLLPISQEANPHWGLKYNLSSGMYFAASWILSMTSCLSSSTGDLVVISPRTTFFSPDTLAKGAKPPDLSSSNSRNRHSHPLLRTGYPLRNHRHPRLRRWNGNYRGIHGC